MKAARKNKEDTTSQEALETDDVAQQRYSYEELMELLARQRESAGNKKKPVATSSADDKRKYDRALAREAKKIKKLEEEEEGSEWEDASHLLDQEEKQKLAAGAVKISKREIPKRVLKTPGKTTESKEDNSSTNVGDNVSKRVSKSPAQNKDVQQSPDRDNSDTNVDDVDAENSRTNFDENVDGNTDDPSVANKPINPSDPSARHKGLDPSQVATPFGKVQVTNVEGFENVKQLNLTIQRDNIVVDRFPEKSKTLSTAEIITKRELIQAASHTQTFDVAKRKQFFFIFSARYH